MQLKISTDYGIRITLYLATVGGVASAAEIGMAMAVPEQYITALSRPLRKAGILRTVRGASGGFALERKPEEISLRSIIECMEGTTRINRCLEPDHYCSRKAAEICPVRCFYEKVQNAVDEAFENMTIAKLMQPPETGGEKPRERR